MHQSFREVKIFFLRAIIQLEKQLEGIVQEDLEDILIISEHKEKSLELLRASFGSKLLLEIPLQFPLHHLCLCLHIFLNFF